MTWRIKLFSRSSPSQSSPSVPDLAIGVWQRWGISVRWSDLRNTTDPFSRLYFMIEVPFWIQLNKSDCFSHDTIDFNKFDSPHNVLRRTFFRTTILNLDYNTHSLVVSKISLVNPLSCSLFHNQSADQYVQSINDSQGAAVEEFERRKPPLAQQHRVCIKSI